MKLLIGALLMLASAAASYHQPPQVVAAALKHVAEEHGVAVSSDETSAEGHRRTIWFKCGIGWRHRSQVMLLTKGSMTQVIFSRPECYQHKKFFKRFRSLLDEKLKGG